MTDRSSQVSARIEGIQQLGSVVEAMKGIAAARARNANAQIEAVNNYARVVATAMSQVMAPDPDAAPAAGRAKTRTGLLVFCAEQGFAGPFNDHILDSIKDEPPDTKLFVVGTRGVSAIGARRGATPLWSAAMVSHSAGVPKLADAIAAAVASYLDTDQIDRLEVVNATWDQGRFGVARQTLFPIDRAAFGQPSADMPMTYLPVGAVLAQLGFDYLHAMICKAALHAFAAENEARMTAMSFAGSQITRELQTYQAILRRVRQKAITAEIIELGTGVALTLRSRAKGLGPRD
jgi:F-type H+-transporting ATPase subunit gamma